MIDIPAVTVRQMREVDRLMVEKIGVSIIMIMENASRNIAILARKVLGGSVRNKKIIILCGKGNNGGDGLGAARHLINFGARVTCFLAADVPDINQNARIQYNILQNIQADVRTYHEQSSSGLSKDFLQVDLIIDALIGYNLKGNPREPVAEFITKANESKKPILAIDIPSGLDGDSGLLHNPTVKAAATITLALPKVGLLTEKAKEYVGELYVSDLSVPAVVYEKLGINVPNIFGSEEIILLNP
ncbi:NAD(P)H-hydrate epimerase [Candidatus Daviesbacteria bacterium]|nr:NAD(P)H-hydrate epimerase [Candidatus Daviesbacteria bacterium]